MTTTDETTTDELFHLAVDPWDVPLGRELERRFTEQYGERIMGEDAAARLRTLYAALADHNPLSLLRERLGGSPVPPFSPSDPEFQSRDLPPELQATGVDFFRTVIDLVTRYAGEFIARNPDVPVTGPGQQPGLLLPEPDHGPDPRPPREHSRPGQARRHRIRQRVASVSRSPSTPQSRVG